jgi:hypothetical protein
METTKPYFVSWIIWNRGKSNWKPRYKFTRCSTEQKARKLKTNLLKQTSFIEVYITRLI